MTFDGLVVGVEIGLFGVDDGVGVDEVEEVEEDEVELVELVELVLEVDELDEEVCGERSTSKKIVTVEGRLSHRGGCSRGRRWYTRDGCSRAR
jgi:hypothetical protein